MTRRTLGAFAGVLAASLALTACSAQQPATVTKTVSPDVTMSKSAPPKPAPPKPIVWPLTGVKVDKVAQHPALAIKIENSVDARPQTGLELADMVWEEVVEGGITRYVAVFDSQIPATVEPVRSARPMDPAIVAPLGGVLAYSGAQPQFIAAIDASGVQSVIMDKGNPGFRRDGARRAPHNVIGSPQTFLSQARPDRKSPPPPQFGFAAAVGKGTASSTGTPANHLDVRMSGIQRTVWDWDAASGMYQRSDGTRPSVSTSGARMSARNVLLLSVQMLETQWRDPAGNPVPETHLVGNGSGVLASGGRSVPLTWSKASIGDLMVLKGADGKQILLDPGNTWVELVPTNASGRWDIS